MKRFFFNIDFGAYEQDEEGAEFTDLAAAGASAVRLMGEIPRDQGNAFGPRLRRPSRSLTRTVLFYARSKRSGLKGLR